ncbi:MAG: hypothetical protein IPO42_11230 [Chitinophagaceae bacterium]|nr:hypothetical protein [Chitinophagaceae bacterium]
MKKILYILILLIGITFTSFAQNTNPAQGEPIAKLIKPYPIPATTVINFDFQYGYNKTFSCRSTISWEKDHRYYSNASPHQHVSRRILPWNYVYQLRDKEGKIIESGKFQVVK